MMKFTWSLTVCWLTFSLEAIIFLARPSPKSRRTSFSLVVSGEVGAIALELGLKAGSVTSNPWLNAVSAAAQCIWRSTAVHQPLSACPTGMFFGGNQSKSG